MQVRAQGEDRLDETVRLGVDLALRPGHRSTVSIRLAISRHDADRGALTCLPSNADEHHPGVGQRGVSSE